MKRRTVVSLLGVVMNFAIASIDSPNFSSIDGRRFVDRFASASACHAAACALNSSSDRLAPLARLALRNSSTVSLASLFLSAVAKSAACIDTAAAPWFAASALNSATSSVPFSSRSHAVKTSRSSSERSKGRTKPSIAFAWSCSHSTTPLITSGGPAKLSLTMPSASFAASAPASIASTSTNTLRTTTLSSSVKKAPTSIILPITGEPFMISFTLSSPAFTSCCDPGLSGTIVTRVAGLATGSASPLSVQKSSPNSGVGGPAMCSLKPPITRACASALPLRLSMSLKIERATIRLSSVKKAQTLISPSIDGSALSPADVFAVVARIAACDFGLIGTIVIRLATGSPKSDCTPSAMFAVTSERLVPIVSSSDLEPRRSAVPGAPVSVAASAGAGAKRLLMPSAMLSPMDFWDSSFCFDAWRERLPRTAACTVAAAASWSAARVGATTSSFGLEPPQPMVLGR